MDIVNEQVQHNRFGMGRVTDQSIDVITVEFSESHTTKSFLYPSAFESFLTLCNPLLQEKQMDEIRQIQACIEAEQEQKRIEDENRRAEKEAVLLSLKKKTTPKSKAKKSKVSKATPEIVADDADDEEI